MNLACSREEGKSGWKEAEPTGWEHDGGSEVTQVGGNDSSADRTCCWIGGDVRGELKPQSLLSGQSNQNKGTLTKLEGEGPWEDTSPGCVWAGG